MVKKIFKVLSIIFLILVFAILVLYLYLTDFGNRDLLTGAPKKAKLEVPITYTVGWWNDLDSLTIDTLDIKIEDSQLNLFNTRSLVSYTVAGSIKQSRNWTLKIKEVHVSERMINDTTLCYDRVIEITPVLKSTESKNSKNEKNLAKFHFKNEHIIYSNRWGINRVKFVCRDKEQVIELRQNK